MMWKNFALTDVEKCRAPTTNGIRVFMIPYKVPIAQVRETEVSNQGRTFSASYRLSCETLV